MGSARLAALAVRAVASEGTDFPRPGAVEGFTLLDMGCSRVAVLGPDGVVYKVMRYPHARRDFEAEWAVFNYLARHEPRSCPDFWPYPAQRVMAMARYRVGGQCVILRELVGDACGRNVGTDDHGNVVLLDGGSGLQAWGSTASGSPAIPA